MKVEDRKLNFLRTAPGNVWAAALLALASLAASAEPALDVADWELPRWVDATQPVEGAFRLESPPSEALFCTFRFESGAAGRVPCERDGAQPGRYTFSIPPHEQTALGSVALQITTAPSKGADAPRRSALRTVALSHVEELDITGDPPVVLLYPLVNEDILVRYIPCCNIFGGVMMTERVGVNPTETVKDLPRHRFSDFAVIEPDGLTAATAGLYMQFRFDPKAVQEAGVERVAPYLWTRHGWHEMLAYEVDLENGTVDFQCADGGIFVIGEKGARASEKG